MDADQADFELAEGLGEAADGGRAVLGGEHFDDMLGGAKEFHGSAAGVGAVAVLFGAVQVAVLAEISHDQPRLDNSNASQYSGKTM